MRYDAAIIGGGAAGLAAAVKLCKLHKNVVLLEKQDRVGRKLLSTGNGRCNITNINADCTHYYGDVSLAKSVIDRHTPAESIAFFNEIGIDTRIDSEGRVYPMSNQAASVLDGLRLSLQEMDAAQIAGFCVKSIKPTKRGFEVTNEAGEAVEASKILIATGGVAAPKLGACADGYALLKTFGHKITPRFPALSPIKTTPEAVKGLKGQRLECAVSLCSKGKIVKTEIGELLFGDASISGIAAMQLSREAGIMLNNGEKPCLSIRIIENAVGFIKKRIECIPNRSIEDFLTGTVSKRIGQAIMRSAGCENQLRPITQLTDKNRNNLISVLESWQMPITGVYGFENAQITAGGAALADFNKNLESKHQPGVFAAGEVLNIDGECGGYNLQWAWASAFTAAEAMI